MFFFFPKIATSFLNTDSIFDLLCWKRCVHGAANFWRESCIIFGERVELGNVHKARATLPQSNQASSFDQQLLQACLVMGLRLHRLTVGVRRRPVCIARPGSCCLKIARHLLSTCSAGTHSYCTAQRCAKPEPHVRWRFVDLWHSSLGSCLARSTCLMASGFCQMSTQSSKAP